MKLVLRSGGLALAWVAALEIVAAGGSLHARREVSEQQLMARIESEGNPTKKAKLEIELGGLKLNQAIAAYDRDQFDAGPKLLETYWGWMKQAWDLLEKSGRDAGRKPQGFKDLDIALREHARRLNDLKQRTPYADRPNIEHTAAEIDALHTQVLAALFPGGHLKESAPSEQAKPAPRPSSALRPGDPR
jgi:hypothetical protein